MAETKSLSERVRDYIHANWPISVEELFAYFREENDEDLRNALSQLTEGRVIQVAVEPKDHWKTLIGPRLS